MTDPIASSYRFALESAVAALERHTGANPESKSALIEAVWWIAAADGYLDEAYKEVWREHKKRHKHPALLDGIYWARNRAIHYPLSLASITEPSERYPETYQEGYGTWTWAPLSQIEKLDRERANDRRRPSYANELAGKPIVTTLQAAVSSLLGLDLEMLEDPNG